MLKKICLKPGCHQFALDGHRYCKDHLDLETEKRFTGGWLSDSAKSLYHSSKWHEISRNFLEENPFCQYCAGLATEVHHDYPIEIDYHTPELFYDVRHLVPVCRECHQKITRKRMIERQRLNREKRQRLWY